MATKAEILEENISQVDELRVAYLVENIHTLLTEDEREKLKRLARSVARLNLLMSEIALPAAARSHEKWGDGMSARAAVARHFELLTIQEMIARENELTVM